jgi:hypothetical protein
VADTGLLVYGDPNADLSALGVQENYRLRVADKLSASIGAAQTSSTVVIEFYTDTDMSTELWKLFAAGASLRANPDLKPNQLLVTASYATLEAVAGWDETAYVFPASPALIAGQPVASCGEVLSPVTGVAAATNLVPTFGDGWAGASHGAAAINYLLHLERLPLNAADVEADTAGILAEWSSYAQITFTPTTATGAARTIEISFPSGDHGDGSPFTPNGAVLAHTFYPPPNPEPIAGDMHVNYDESWSVSGSLELYPVMLHELGHALGLGHTDDPSAVMYPYYQGLQHLSSIDIATLQTLYAKPAATAPATTTTETTTDATPVAPTLTPAPATPTTPSADHTPPVLTLYSPALRAFGTAAATLTVKGFATDNVGVASIAWTNSAGGSGTTAVASPFTISSIPLVPGVNRITIAAADAAGNTATALLTVTRN